MGATMRQSHDVRFGSIEGESQSSRNVSCSSDSGRIVAAKHWDDSEVTIKSADVFSSVN
jgi:hypothetical protein